MSDLPTLAFAGIGLMGLPMCRRLLAAGGRLLLSTSNPDWPYFAPGALSVSYPSATELLDLLRQAGFEQVQSQYPFLKQRVPKTLIAAYIGVSRETLSRLGP